MLVASVKRGIADWDVLMMNRQLPPAHLINKEKLVIFCFHIKQTLSVFNNTSVTALILRISYIILF